MVVNQQNVERLGRLGGFLAVVGFPVSVSVSQLGLFLAVSVWIYNEARQGQLWQRFHGLPASLGWALAIFAVLFLSLCLATLRADDPWRVFAAGWKTELKDVFLSLGAVWAYYLARERQGRRNLLRWLRLATLVLLGSGLVSIFSKYRLSKILYHLRYGWEGSDLARFQHHAGTLFSSGDFSLHLYMPIGFMNTHLTYAALLGLVLPVLGLRFLDVFVRSPRRILRRPVILTGAGLGLGLIILVLNNGRSAILGFCFALLVAVLYYTKHRWRLRALRLLIPVLGMVLALVVLVSFSRKMHDRFARLVDGVTGRTKHTDYQRLFVWQAGMDIWKRHLWTGTGPGRFVPEANATVIRFSQEKPRLWYAYQVIQRGHAHNDLLHLLAIGGILAGLMYLFFFGTWIKQILGATFSNKYGYYRWGPLLLLAGGLLQCYFQDDEVVLPFWILVGLSLGVTERGVASYGQAMVQCHNRFKNESLSEL